MSEDEHEGDELSTEELREVLLLAEHTGIEPNAVSALATVAIGVTSLEALDLHSPEVAKFVSSYGDRLLSIAQAMGLPLMPPGVGDRAHES